LKKVGLFGGTFDPVHNGHISIARSFIDSGNIEELWILLTPNPPHKIDGDQVKYTTRLSMLKKAFEGIDVSILTIENDLPKPSYTFQTIRYLKKEYSNYVFYFCMGEDSLAQFHTWKFFKEILEEADLLVAKRPGNEHKKVLPEILSQTTFVSHLPVPISSSEIRTAVAKGNDVKTLVPPEVLELIVKEHLYK
tara:strand:+ start:820 stop:1398 length:579 start_codon:yes stop_codon:yes gene_type:complete